jgi:hypothetical protein
LEDDRPLIQNEEGTLETSASAHKLDAGHILDMLKREPKENIAYRYEPTPKAQVVLKNKKDRELFEKKEMFSTDKYEDKLLRMSLGQGNKNYQPMQISKKEALERALSS